MLWSLDTYLQGSTAGVEIMTLRKTAACAIAALYILSQVLFGTGQPGE